MNSKFVYFQSTFLVEYMCVPLFKIGENLIHSTEMIHGDDLLLSLRSIWKLVRGTGTRNPGSVFLAVLWRNGLKAS